MKNEIIRQETTSRETEWEKFNKLEQMKNIKGDSPCAECGTKKNIVWFADNVFWNDVMGEEKQKILCINCFTARAEKKYKRITGWRLLPDFRWE